MRVIEGGGAQSGWLRRGALFLVVPPPSVVQVGSAQLTVYGLYVKMGNNINIIQQHRDSHTEIYHLSVRYRLLEAGREDGGLDVGPMK